MNSAPEIIFLVEEDPEGGYFASAIGESIFTQGETIAELREMIRDAVQCHFDAAQRPKMIRLHIVRDEVIAS
jgi:predicted RNase H-like HicB family nuclease